jgi:hypothetical protein
MLGAGIPVTAELSEVVVNPNDSEELEVLLKTT